MPKSQSLSCRKGNLHDILRVCVGGGRESGRQQALGDWRAVVKQLPRVTSRGSRGNRRAPQIHEFAPSRCLPFPTASQQSSGCSWATVLDRGWTRALLLLSPLDATCGLCATLSGLSLSSHIPRVLFMFLPQSYAILHLERSIFFSNPASSPTFCLWQVLFLILSSHLLNFGFLKKKTSKNHLGFQAIL